MGFKLSPYAEKKMKAIADRLNTSVYALLQGFCDVAIRMMDNKVEMTDELARMVSIFDGQEMRNWDKAIHVTDPEEYHVIVAAIYFMTMPEQKHPYHPGKDGSIPVLVEGASNTMFATETYNLPHIIEFFMCNVLPKNIYRRLREYTKEELGSESIYEGLIHLIGMQKVNEDEAELRRMFSDNDWERGHKMSDQQGHKSTRNNHPELFQ